jgi:predicted ribosome quality control (RQC) complex YloA/Tae2 family protein
LDVELLRIGRHFRIGNNKVIVGRNKEENKKLSLSTMRNKNLSTMEVKDYLGPVTVLVGKADAEMIGKAAAITVRYSDAPKNSSVAIKYGDANGHKDLEATAMSDDELRQFNV